MTSRRREAQTLLVIVLVALVACGGPVDPEGPSGEDVVVTDEAVVVTLPSGGTVTIPPVAAGETAVVTVAESTLPFTGEFAPLEWLTAAVSLTTEDDAAWTEDAIVHLSLPLRGSAALSTQAFEVTSAGRVDGRSHGAYGARGTGD